MSLTKTRERMLSDSSFHAPIDNIVINGGMEVDQEHAGAAVSIPGLYVLDEWIGSKTGTMVCTSQQVADAPAGFSNSLKITVGTAQASLGAGDYCFIYQPIEGFRSSKLGFGAAGAQSVTLSFWTKIHRTGAYSGAISNGTGTRVYPFSFTQNVADTWEYKTVTIPGDVTGTWAGNTNALAMRVVFTMACGTTYIGTANTWAAANLVGVTGTTNGVAATSDVFQIAGVCLIPGTDAPSAAVSPLLKRSFDTELVLCQRYYQKSFPYSVVPAQNAGIAGSVDAIAVSTSAGSGSLRVTWPSRMRAGPTVITYNTSAADANWWDTNGAASRLIGVAEANNEGVRLVVNAITSAGSQHFVHWTADARL
jgi:hypothetical protein